MTHHVQASIPGEKSNEVNSVCIPSKNITHMMYVVQPPPPRHLARTTNHEIEKLQNNHVHLNKIDKI